MKNDLRYQAIKCHLALVCRRVLYEMRRQLFTPAVWSSSPG